MTNMLHLIIKVWISCYSTARIPGFPMVAFQKESRSVSHFCVYGRSKLWYQVHPKPNQLPIVMAVPPIQNRLSSLGSCVTQSILDFLPLRLDLFFPYTARESRQVLKKQTEPVEQSKWLFLFCFSPNGKQNKCCRQSHGLWMKSSWETEQCWTAKALICVSVNVCMRICVCSSQAKNTCMHRQIHYDCQCSANTCIVIQQQSKRWHCFW